MYRYLLKLMIRRALGHHQAGDVDALLKFYGKDARFVFPGKNSWAGSSEVRKQSGLGCGAFIRQD
jgi:ketosteroid isomerase-like protein